jgi:hypothetical protein
VVSISILEQSKTEPLLASFLQQQGQNIEEPRVTGALGFVASLTEDTITKL